MMQFSLHVTCSCIHTFSFPCLVLFVMVLIYLSPSLSLLNSLHMASKCKSAPSWNPFRFGASFFDPTPLHVWFCDEKALQDFSENFSKHGIHSERHVILSDFSDTTLLTVNHRRGWNLYVRYP